MVPRVLLSRKTRTPHPDAGVNCGTGPGGHRIGQDGYACLFGPGLQSGGLIVRELNAGWPVRRKPPLRFSRTLAIFLRSGSFGPVRHDIGVGNPCIGVGVR